MATHRGVDPDQLTGEAARQFDAFCRMHETFGSPPDQAVRFAVNDLIDAGIVRLSRFDRLIDGFRQSGMSETAALAAAVGRHGSELEARRAMDGPPAGAGPAGGSQQSPKLTGPAALVAFHEAIEECRAWREASKLAETDALRAAALDRSMAALERAVSLAPDRHLEGLPARSPAGPKAGKPGKRIVEVDGRLMVEERSLITGQLVLTEAPAGSARPAGSKTVLLVEQGSRR